MKILTTLNQHVFYSEECPSDATVVVVNRDGCIYFGTYTECNPIVNNIYSGYWDGVGHGEWVEAKGYRCPVTNWPEGYKLYRSFHC